MEISIVGTGVSALLLAQSILRHDDHATVRVFGRNLKQHPHLLSLWSDRATPFDSHCIAEWDHLAVVSSDHRPTLLSLEHQRYRTFRAQDWADAVKTELLSSGRVSFILEQVTSLERHSTRPAVLTASARFEADWVFTSAQALGAPAQTQRFLGSEVQLARPLSSIFPHFLDFRTPQDGDFRFIYTLPLGTHRLFVEHVSYKPCDHRAAIQRYLTQVLSVGEFTEVDSEAGATPLFRTRPPRFEGRVVGIGVHAGLAKPATGYAVMRMWRDSEELAQSLAKYGQPRVKRGQPSLQRLADDYFLDMMNVNPSQLETVLSMLFRKVPGDAVLAFLDEQASLMSQVRVATAMPMWLRWLFSVHLPRLITHHG